MYGAEAFGGDEAVTIATTRRLVITFGLVLLCVGGGATAQAQQRLSHWLVTHSSADAYPLGLMWRTPEETERQAVEYQALQRELAQLPNAQSMLHALHAMPPTGRVRVSAAHAQWLEANPKRDPVLQPQDAVVMPTRPVLVRVLTSDGAACDTPHKVGLQAQQYVAVCYPQGVGAWGWLVQPDGRVQKVGLHVWNRTLQDQPAPGAWIWAPAADSGWPESLHYRWAQWMATQGVSEGLPLQSFATFHRQVAAQPELATVFDFSGQFRYDAQPTASNWGNIGLLQTPTARMREAGHFALGFHHAWPYSQAHIFLQPLNRVEFGFRYVDFANRMYGPQYYSGDQTYKDKSIDLKLRAWQESDYMPEISVGWRDMGGTGLFSSEYVVASKRTGRLDWSGGFAWGYMGGRASMSNPLSHAFGARFDVRQFDEGHGGKFASTGWFHGRTSPFLGVSYESPWHIVLKAEYESNNYQHEPKGNVLKVKSPLNWGLVYRPWRGVDVSAGWERGDTLAIGVTFYTDLSGLSMPKLTDPAIPAVSMSRPQAEPDWSQTAREIEALTQWQVQHIYRADDALVVEANRTQNPYPQLRLDKAMAVIHRDAPEDVNRIEVHHANLGSVLAVEEVNRQAWVKSQTEPTRTQERSTPVPPTYTLVPVSGATTVLSKRDEAMGYIDPGLDFIQTLGGPDGFVMYQFSAIARMGLKLPADVQLKGEVRGRLLNNYDRFKNTGSSSLPRVRTYMREYFVTSPVTMTNLSVSKSGRASQSLYWAAYGGYFEEMFAGVGGEVLYRQPASRWAVGVDANQVRQRAFEQNFDFRDYKVNTGHVTTYWATPLEGVHASLAVGQYLAGDRGATLSVSKVFANGAVMGAYATKTNVPAAVFGEGSFDKGIYWGIPFDAFLTSSSRSFAKFGWSPLTRDGGARVGRPVNLYGETAWLSPLMNTYLPASPPNDAVAPDDRR